MTSIVCHQTLVCVGVDDIESLRATETSMHAELAQLTKVVRGLEEECHGHSERAVQLSDRLASVTKNSESLREQLGSAESRLGTTLVEAEARQQALNAATAKVGGLEDGLAEARGELAVAREEVAKMREREGSRFAELWEAHNEAHTNR